MDLQFLIGLQIQTPRHNVSVLRCTVRLADRGQRERESGGVSPLVSGSTQFANE
jgi:hypothetical protein